MKKSISRNSKKNYEIPAVEKIIIDKTISLQLASSPPAGPSETNNVKPNQLVNPFKNELA